MRVVLDASVVVAACRSSEALQPAAQQWVRRVLSGKDTLVVPSLFAIEVTSALARSGMALEAVDVVLSRLLGFAGEVATLGPKRALKVAAMAARLKLRAADSCYVWLATERRATLVTGNAEVLQRASGVCKLAELGG